MHYIGAMADAIPMPYHALSTPVSVVDADGRVVAANQAFARWLGVGGRRLVGLPLVSLEVEGDALARALAEAGDRDFLRLQRIALGFPGSGTARFADLLLGRDGGG